MCLCVHRSGIQPVQSACLGGVPVPVPVYRCVETVVKELGARGGHRVLVYCAVSRLDYSTAGLDKGGVGTVSPGLRYCSVVRSSMPRAGILRKLDKYMSLSAFSTSLQHCRSSEGGRGGVTEFWNLAKSPIDGSIKVAPDLTDSNQIY